MKLYNTLTRNIEELGKENAKVRIYLCGVTVYDESHIGHARTVIVFDVLRRYLVSKGRNIVFVQNFTDVDDKIINRAKSMGVKAEEVSERYIKRYFEDFGELNVLAADHYPRATQHISEMIHLIEGLVKTDHAYITLNGVYFRVKSFPEYGKLSKKPIEELESGSRVEVDPSKESPLDFALWKFSSEEPVWPSPWGKGRPGWHIECSAMALKYLDPTPFEIHGGGHDLVFPHHENEIAQSESFTGKQFAKMWMHSGMVTIKSEKMSKSIGNIVTIKDALEQWGKNTLRMYCVSVHYAKPLDYSEELLKESVQRWRQIETCVYELRFAAGTTGGDTDAIAKICRESESAFGAAMDEDMNTALAIGEFMKFVTAVNRYAASEKLTKAMADTAAPTLEKFMYTFGLTVAEATNSEKDEIENLIQSRNKMRAEKKFAESDQIRKKLLEQYSVELMDHKGRTIWKKIEKSGK